MLEEVLGIIEEKRALEQQRLDEEYQAKLQAEQDIISSS
jgi:hypothetical protein